MSPCLYMKKFKAKAVMVESISVVAWFPRIRARMNCIGTGRTVRSDGTVQDLYCGGCI